MAARNNLDFTGAYVRSLGRSDPATRAGLRPGDTVVAVNGQAVTTRDQIDRLVVRQPSGAIKLDVVKEDGRRTTIDVPSSAAGPGRRAARPCAMSRTCCDL